MIAASLVLLALVAGVVVTTVGLVEAKKQEAEARRQEGIAREQEAEAKKQEGIARGEAAAKEKAETERQVAEAVKDFLQTKLLAQAGSTAAVRRPK